ncbi:MAG: hypothetical protein JRJ41_05675 [Deltaproteobacteria bacterium]|nr:hypothetical protein [Deltaproteobacteria bacterium]MBW2250126.1 hypothetical protein [Deltaproteobacteria bacterium]
MKKLHNNIALFVSLIMLIPLSACGVTKSMTKKQTLLPWYRQMDVKTPDFEIVYSLENAYAHEHKWPEVNFYDPYSMRKITDQLAEYFDTMDPDEERIFIGFLFKEEVYKLDTNNDGEVDVIHRISHMPTTYINEEFCKMWNLNIGSMEGFLLFVREAHEKGIDMKQSVFQVALQVLVNARIDANYDGVPDFEVIDNFHKAETTKKSYGGDGEIDEIKKLVPEPNDEAHPLNPRKGFAI